MQRICALTLLLAGLSAGACASSAGVRLAPDLSAPAALERWELRNPGMWTVQDGVLRLHTRAQPSGPIRKPGEWAILKGEPVGDFTLTAEVRADSPEDRMGRDVLIFFGYQSPSRFYYVHLSNETTNPHNGIFLVNDADRVRLDDLTSVPRLLDDEWHTVRVERDVDSGRIAVYFDDIATPVLQAVDTTLGSGRVGFGSFDDTAELRRIELRGEAP